MNTDAEKERRCPGCGALIPPEAKKCWLCHGRPDDAEEASGSTFVPPDPVAATGELPVVQSEYQARFQFSLGSMMLLVTLTAVILGVFATVPGLGVALAILAAPALIRTAVLASRRQSTGHPMEVQAKLSVFIGTLALVAVIVAAAVGAFVATCFPIGLAGFSAESEFLFVFAWVAGLVVAILVIYGLIRAFRRQWPRGD